MIKLLAPRSWTQQDWASCIIGLRVGVTHFSKGPKSESMAAIRAAGGVVQVLTIWEQFASEIVVLLLGCRWVLVAFHEVSGSGTFVHLDCHLEERNSEQHVRGLVCYYSECREELFQP